MREIPKDVISCQLSFYPLGQPDYLQSIDTVLALIQNSGLKHDVHDMSTVLQGASEDVFALLHTINKKMSEEQCRYAMTVTISNTCGL